MAMLKIFIKNLARLESLSFHFSEFPCIDSDSVFIVWRKWMQSSVQLVKQPAHCTLTPTKYALTSFWGLCDLKNKGVVTEPGTYRIMNLHWPKFAFWLMIRENMIHRSLFLWFIPRYMRFVTQTFSIKRMEIWVELKYNIQNQSRTFS